MTEKEILDLIKNDPWMMDILKTADMLNFPDWVIGAGFIRNKVWDYLHEFSHSKVDTADVDLVYYDQNGNDQETDEVLSKKLREETGIEWEIVNEAYAHKWNSLPPYTSTKDALSQWPETATGIGVKIDRGELKLVAPYGIEDLVNLIVRPSPRFLGGIEMVKERAAKKKWFEKWPKLRFGS